jgi:hypothetical protein
MTNNRSQLLVPIRITGDSEPYIMSTDNDRTPFVPGKAVLCASGELAYISDNVEFFFVH